MYGLIFVKNPLSNLLDYSCNCDLELECGKKSTGCEWPEAFINLGLPQAFYLS